ncbi:MAG TPA: 16S rRNA (guanine(527)-N(7))-methyltransferase RsmG [Afifellaceae bacterium]|nr:16S rRNA (guanine(527)-N(7))-methyltransferase RsmG [Afifellaceae bacterium]
MAAESAGCLDGLDYVSEQAKARLKDYVALLGKWQTTHNLVSAATLDHVWSRHILDSAQLLGVVPDARRWIDMGSGAGFPGMVIAILLADRDGARVTLVESNHKKCAFLRAVARQTNAPVDVACERVESFAQGVGDRADVISARALAPFSDLLRLAEPMMSDESVLLLLKGQDFVYEEQNASKSWGYDLVLTDSITDPGGRIVAVRKLKGKG